ncbi:MAG: type IV toxin-antitoxin system AbiEi family antitoxin domain-containing protein [Verrucomicrobiota bacterium]
MDTRQQVLDIVKRKVIVRSSDLEQAGLPRNYLYTLCRKGLLKRIARGLYALPDMMLSEHAALAETAKRVPHAVACLLSALDFHGITTQLPHEVWIAVPRGAWRPRIEYPPLHLTYMSGDAYSFGIQKHDIAGVSVKIYSPAKTVADCFKFRNTVGLDVAIEALRETWRSRKASIDELMEAAGVCKVSKVMRPYMEASV